MKHEWIDTGQPRQRVPRPRSNARVAVKAEVLLGRPGQRTYRVRAYDFSRSGCKIEFIERPQLDERVWVKFEGLEALSAWICWLEGFVAGAEFERAIHPAVFDHWVSRFAK
jgi:hypothetical protein